MINIHHLSLYYTPSKSNAINIEQTLYSQLNILLENKEIKGKKIALAVGSRFIKDQNDILKCLIGFLLRKEAIVSIIPAMGSHGGATAEGQKEVLGIAGITEETMGVPIVSSPIPEAILVKHPISALIDPLTLYIDKNALESDYVILINRIKPHTSFKGTIQSGLCKMACIGLGKPQGARYYHRLFSTYSFETVLPILTTEVLNRVPILAGLALVEDENSNVTSLSVLPPNAWLDEEPILLKLAVSNMPHIPFDTADILIVEEFGKHVSGSGLDTNIIGLKTDFFSFTVNYRYIRSLAKGSGGNAVGMGLCDIMHKRVLKDIDFSVSYINAETSLSPDSVKIPITYATDSEAIESLYRMGGYDTFEPSLVWILNTSNLQYILTNKLISHSPYSLIRENISVKYDESGNFPSFQEIISSAI